MFNHIKRHRDPELRYSAQCKCFRSYNPETKRCSDFSDEPMIVDFGTVRHGWELLAASKKRDIALAYINEPLPPQPSPDHQMVGVVRVVVASLGRCTIIVDSDSMAAAFTALHEEYVQAAEAAEGVLPIVNYTTQRAVSWRTHPSIAEPMKDLLGGQSRPPSLGNITMKTDFYANATPFADMADIGTDELELPYGFMMDDTGLWYQAELEDRRTPKKTRICSPISVAYRVRDTQGHYGFITEFNGRDGNHVQCFVPDALLHKNAKEVAAHIADLGLEIETNNAARDRLQCFLNKQTAAFAVYLQQSGWVKNIDGEDAYALPSGEIIGAGGIIMRPDRCMRGCLPAGTLKDWQDNLAWYARGNDRLAFSIACGFAAPLMQQINLPSGGFHWLGFSQTGKTTLLAAASSVVGMAHLGEGYVRSWRGTDNAMEAVAAAHNDSLLPLDEMSQAPAKDVAQMLYQFGNGGGKSRMKADGTMRHTYTWRTLVLSTGEETPEDKIRQAGQEANAGVIVRLTSIPAIAGRLGVFDTTHEFASPKELADHLRAASRKYYGTALPAFIAEYIQHKDAYNETINERCNTFMDRHLKSKDAAGQAWSVCHRFALVAVAGELATEFSILPWNKGDATKAADTCFAAWLDERGHLGLAEEEKIITAFRTYIGAYQMTRFLDLDDREARIVTEMVGYKRSEMGRTDFYILPEQMSKVLPGMNVKNAMKVVDTRGFLVREKGRETQKYRLKSLRQGIDETNLTYRISGAILTGE